jgi:hypothetical protein
MPRQDPTPYHHAVIYEVRDYHFRPDRIGAYRQWATEATKVLRDKLDVVGFWIDEGAIEPEIKGTDPMTSPLGSANVTWIIRWDSKAERDERWAVAFGSDEWNAVWATHPDPTGYRQISARFMDAV